MLYRRNCNKIQSLRMYSAGVTIIELLLAVFLVGGIVSALLGFSAFSIGTAGVLSQTAQANAFVQEAVEAVRSFRDGIPWDQQDSGDEYDGLGQVAQGVPYHISMSGDTPPQWRLLAGAETIGIFTRTIVFESARRDAADTIVESGGIADPNTKKVTVEVSWQERQRPHAIEIATYFTNWKQ